MRRWIEGTIYLPSLEVGGDEQGETLLLAAACDVATAELSVEIRRSKGGPLVAWAELTPEEQTAVELVTLRELWMRAAIDDPIARREIAATSATAEALMIARRLGRPGG